MSAKSQTRSQRSVLLCWPTNACKSWAESKSRILTFSDKIGSCGVDSLASCIDSRRVTHLTEKGDFCHSRGPCSLWQNVQAFEHSGCRRIGAYRVQGDRKGERDERTHDPAPNPAAHEQAPGGFRP